MFNINVFLLNIMFLILKKMGFYKDNIYFKQTK